MYFQWNIFFSRNKKYHSIIRNPQSKWQLLSAVVQFSYSNGEWTMVLPLVEEGHSPRWLRFLIFRCERNMFHWNTYFWLDQIKQWLIQFFWLDVICDIHSAVVWQNTVSQFLTFTDNREKHKHNLPCNGVNRWLNNWIIIYFYNKWIEGYRIYFVTSFHYDYKRPLKNNVPTLFCHETIFF